MARFVFHYHPLSSYCQKVGIALSELGLEHDREIVNLGDPAARADFKSLWPTAKIPLLEDRERGLVIPETSIQIEYLCQHSSEGRRLLPPESGTVGDSLDARLQVRLWDRLMDCYLMTPMQAITGDRLRPEDQRDPLGVSRAREQIAATYQMMESRLAQSSWLGGANFSIADCSAAPALWYANTLVRVESDTPHLLAYFRKLVERPSMKAALDEARPWFKYYPYAEAIPAEFL